MILILSQARFSHQSMCPPAHRYLAHSANPSKFRSDLWPHHVAATLPYLRPRSDLEGRPEALGPNVLSHNLSTSSRSNCTIASQVSTLSARPHWREVEKAEMLLNLMEHLGCGWSPDHTAYLHGAHGRDKRRQAVYRSQVPKNRIAAAACAPQDSGIALSHGAAQSERAHDDPTQNVP